MENDAPGPNKCHMRASLVKFAADMESANTLAKLVICLRSLRTFWGSFKYHSCGECENSQELSRLAIFVMNTVGDKIVPDDRCIVELIGINLRASALLAQGCRRRDRMDHRGNLDAGDAAGVFATGAGLPSAAMSVAQPAE